MAMAQSGTLPAAVRETVSAMRMCVARCLTHGVCTMIVLAYPGMSLAAIPGNLPSPWGCAVPAGKRMRCIQLPESWLGGSFWHVTGCNPGTPPRSKWGCAVPAGKRMRYIQLPESWPDGSFWHVAACDPRAPSLGNWDVRCQLVDGVQARGDIRKNEQAGVLERGFGRCVPDARGHGQVIQLLLLWL